MRTIAEKYSMTPGIGVVVYDSLALTAASLGATAVGAGVSAAGTIAGGGYAKQAGQMQKQESEFQAEQLDENASQAIASGQRQSMDTRLQTQLAISRSRVVAAGSGFNAGTGSPLTNTGELAQRGEYHALMDMWNGRSTATGLENQAKGVRYSGDIAELEGEEKDEASKLAAAGTIAGAAGSMAKSYGAYAFPQYRWGA